MGQGDGPDLRPVIDNRVFLSGLRPSLGVCVSIPVSTDISSWRQVQFRDGRETGMSHDRGNDQKKTCELTSSKKHNPNTTAAKFKRPPIKQGRKYGYSIKKEHSPNMDGKFCAGRAKKPPMIGPNIDPIA